MMSDEHLALIQCLLRARAFVKAPGCLDQAELMEEIDQQIEAVKATDGSKDPDPS